MPLSQLPGKLGNLALQNSRILANQFPLQRLDDRRVVVAGVVDAIPGQEIEDIPIVFGLQFPGAPAVAHVHLQCVEKRERAVAGFPEALQ